MKINRNEAIIQSILKEKDGFQKKQINIGCDIEILEVSIEDIISEENIQFIDVRELHEYPKVENLEVTYIPLSELEHNIDKIDSTKKKVLFCQSAVRSKRAVNLLQELNIKNTFSLKEGASEIINHIQEQHKMSSQ
ncbi:MAG: rhodanese-like domain-containing protein [Psychroserpens sp.]|uniref:rhodanese-like domain-containing protein n=1 Tax=Psychroserpens sp. TaxID=2020870 RepID=UPI0030028C9F